ncbi:hypothetical protein ACF0H5_017937 [Mactra antiquata]
MEDEERDQKLKAGKEKLAQFQKKKKKKSPNVNDAEDKSTNIAAATGVVASESHSDHAHTLLTDNGSGDRISTPDVDTRRIVDGNDDIDVNSVDTNQSSNSRETCDTRQENVQSNNDRSEHPSVNLSDVQDLLHTVQWLQLQLNQANSVVLIQNKKHSETVGALENAKKEINALQDCINEKDQLLNNIVEKMAQISKEYTTLKQNYVQLTKVHNQDMENVLEREAKLREELKEAVKTELDDKDSIIQKHEELYNSKLVEIKEKAETRVVELEEELAKMKDENYNLISLSERHKTECENLEEKCTTLTKALEFLKAEHESSVNELEKMSGEFKDLVSINNNLNEENEKLLLKNNVVESNNVDLTQQITLLQASLHSVEVKHAESADIESKLKSEIEMLLKDNAALVDELSKVKDDNCLHQKQIESYEEKLHENEEVLDENHSLHLQNDELNNKINNQKDTIASLKNELNILSSENKLLNDQNESLSTLQVDNDSLKDEKETLLRELSDFKSKIKMLEDENADLKECQSLLNKEVSDLKENLLTSDTKNTVNEQFQPYIQTQRQFILNTSSDNVLIDESKLVHEAMSAETVSRTLANNVHATIPDARIPQAQASSRDDHHKMSFKGCVDDTAYESFQSGATCQVLTESSHDNANGIQKEYENVKQALHSKTLECQELQKLLEEAMHKLNSATSVPTLHSDEHMDSVTNLSDNGLSKVSENASVTSLEQEVNMHASSSLCFVENDDVVPLDSQGIVSVGESHLHVLPSDVFQSNTDHQLATDPAMSNMTESTDEVSLLQEEICKLKTMLKESFDNINELKDTIESHLQRENKLQNDYDKLCEGNTKLLSQLKEQLDDMYEKEEATKQLKHMNEKLTWECNEIRTVNDELEKKLLEIKSDKCEVEFEKLRFEEELKRVKDRLEYLESSDCDIMEIKDMLEKVQNDRENIVNDNEKLQGSLSAQIQENEKLIETLECLHKENSSSFNKLKELNNEMSRRCSEVEHLTHDNMEMKTKLEKQEQKFLSYESKSCGEIDGLLEENSTLKTSIDMKNAEIENLKLDIDRLNSFFPNIDEKSDSHSMKILCDDLEVKVQELTVENEQLMNEIFLTQEKMSKLADENESISDKCEELQKVIYSMEDEKCNLVITADKIKEEMAAQLDELNNIIRKYEIQLEGLDQENSTLKTQLSSLKLDIEEKCEAVHHDSNHAQLFSNKTNLLKEKQLYEEKCTTLEAELREIKEREQQLLDKLKMYESHTGFDLNVSETEIKRLSDQLELERKYKLKFERDLEVACHEVDSLKEEKSNLESVLSQQVKDMDVLVNENKKMKENEASAVSKLQVIENENKKLMNECKEMKRNAIESDKTNDSLSRQNSMLQHHIQAMSDNCVHVRNQVDILAAELEVSNNEKDSIKCQYHELTILYDELKVERIKMRDQINDSEVERLELQRECEKLMAEYESLTAKLDEEDVYDCNENDVLKEDLEKTYCALEDVKMENVKLKEDLSSFGLRSEELNELKLTNSNLNFEIVELKNQNDFLNEMIDCLKKKINEVDKLTNVNTLSTDESDNLVDKLDSLHESIIDLQTEKESLQKLTDNLTDMLHDMQGKYEEVKSEMETTKKEYSKEISQLENKLHDMNADVCHLRRMLDCMENEICSASDEKLVLKENLNEQQIQFAEVVQEKQKLEEIINKKLQKDLKNMQVASQKQNAAEQVSQLLDQSGAVSEMNTTLQSSEETNSSLVQQNLTMESVTSCHIPSEVPSFENALHLFGFDDHDGNSHHCRLVQTNISYLRDDHHVLVDDNGENFSENIKDLNLTDSQTQTVLAEFVLPKHFVSETIECINIPSTESLNQSVETSFQCEHLCDEDTFVNLPAEKSADSLQPNVCMSCTEQTNISDSETINETCELSQIEISSDVSKEPSLVLADTLSTNIPSGIEIPPENKQEDVPPSVYNEMKDVSSQTELDVLNIVSEAVNIEREHMMSEFEAKVAQIEVEVESNLLKKLEFREEKVKVLEDNYEKKVKQIEYDMEETLVQKFRHREAEIVLEAERDKKTHATEVENASRRKIEQITIEKNQQFVEAMRQVKADFYEKEKKKSSKERRVKRDKGRHEGAKVGPSGDMTVRDGTEDGQLHKLKTENEELMSARDVLLRQIDISQQEQEVLVEQLQVIIGEQNTLNHSQHVNEERLMPALLDWELNPEMSFDSVRCSLEVRDSSESLDTHGYCSKSECLNMRMKYDQLIGRIQQFLKMRSTLEGDSQFTDIDHVTSTKQSEVEASSPCDDRFIVNDEPDSQLLQRITSIHLEHSVREPSLPGNDSHNDQFVQEIESDSSFRNEAENASNDIIDTLVKLSTDYINTKNEDGRFSESDSDIKDDQEICVEGYHDVDKEDSIPSDIFPRNKSLFRSIVFDEQLTTSKSEMKKRHFSESDAYQSNEGSFVAEKNACSEDEDVFENSEPLLSKTSNQSNEGTWLSFEKSTLRDDTIPGSERIFVCEKLMSRTGEETGDFFDEKVQYSLSYPPTSALLQNEKQSKCSDNDYEQSNAGISESASESVHFDSGDILEAIVTVNKKSPSNKDLEGNQSQFIIEDNGQGEIAIQSDEVKKTCLSKNELVSSSTYSTEDSQPKDIYETWPPKNPKSEKSHELSYENAVFDILNSICPGTDPGRRPAAGVHNFHPVVSESQVNTTDQTVASFNYNELEEMRLENKKLTSTILSLQNEIAEIRKMEDEHEQCRKDLIDTVSHLKHENHTLEKDLHQVEENSLKTTSEISELKEEVTSLNLALDIKQRDCEELKSLKEKFENELLENKERMKQMSDKFIDNDDLNSKIKKMQDLLEEAEDKNKQLVIEKDGLLDVNKQLIIYRDRYTELEKRQLELKGEIEIAAKGKECLEVLLAELKSDFLREKNELENNLSTIAETFEKLKFEKMEVDNVLQETKQNLTKEKAVNEDLNHENELLIQEVNELKAEKNNLNIMITNMTATSEDLKANAQCIENLKFEKETLNETLQNVERSNKELREIVVEKSNALQQLDKSEQSLNQMVGELQSKTESLENEVDKLNKTLNDITEDNNKLLLFKKENELLKCELSELKVKNDENEWALRELSKDMEKECLDECNDTSDLVTLNSVSCDTDLPDEHITPVYVHANETEQQETGSEISKLAAENKMLRENVDQLKEIDSLKHELETLRLENDTMKQSLNNVITRSDSDTNLLIISDVKDAIKYMEAEKESVEEHRKAFKENADSENKRLQEEIEELYVENNNLRQKLKTQEENARQDNSEILKMYNDLRDEVEVLVISKHDLEIELHALKDLLEQDSCYPVSEKLPHDSSKELTLQDLEEMESLKTSIEKLKSDLKEKDGYVKKLEEHLLNVGNALPDLKSTPKPLLSRGTPKASKSFVRRAPFSKLDRRSYSHDLPDITSRYFSSSMDRSQNDDGELRVADLNSSVSTVSTYEHQPLSSSFVTESLDSSTVTEKIKSGLSPKEDGHLALELKQFELVAEITKLRRDFRETKAVYAKETALLTEALEKEKMTNQFRHMSDFNYENSVSSNVSHDILKLRQEVGRLRGENKMLIIECDRLVDRLQEQEQIVADLQEKVGRNVDQYGEIEEVFGRQLALLQKQRKELLDQLQDKNRENNSLVESLGEKVIIEEALTKEKEGLLLNMKNMEMIEKELDEKKKELEKTSLKLKEVEDVVYQKDLNEIELMKQKRILEEELKEIESKFKDKEENLDFEKNRVLSELKEKRYTSVRSRFSESDDEVSSVCSESATYSNRNIGRLEVMLEEVEKQHSVAVNVLRDQLCSKYRKREKDLREEHGSRLTKLKQDSWNKVNQPQNV